MSYTEKDTYLPGGKTHAKLTSSAFSHLIEKYGLDPTLNLIPRDILDKSKSTAFTWVVISLQTTCFCTQCIFRLSPGYSMSLLELVTFGHSICALLIIHFWWDKPLDVQQSSTLIHASPDLEHHMVFLTLSNLLDGRMRDTVILTYSQASAKSEATRSSIFSSRHIGQTLKGRDFIHGFSLVVSSDKEKKFRKLYPQGYQVQPYDLRRWALAFHIAKRYPDLYYSCFVSAPDGDWHFGSTIMARRVKDISGPKIKQLGISRNHRRSDLYTSAVTSQVHRIGSIYNVLLFAVARMIYGGLHALAWNAPFPSQTQMIMWKISCVTLVATGPVIWLMNQA